MNHQHRARLFDDWVVQPTGTAASLLDHLAHEAERTSRASLMAGQVGLRAPVWVWAGEVQAVIREIIHDNLDTIIEAWYEHCG
jgi:hypothetical protein